ncbi:MAG: hypothetical protein MHM6MM_007026 [Cercozoa sp. M6MM]
MSKLSSLVSIGSGALFAVAIFILADGTAYAIEKDDDVRVKFEHWLTLVGQLIFLIMLNGMSWEQLNANSMQYGGDTSIATKARAFALLAFAIGFGSLIGAIFAYINKWGCGDCKPQSKWPGASIIFSNGVAFIAAIIWRIGRNLLSPSDAMF